MRAPDLAAIASAAASRVKLKDSTNSMCNLANLLGDWESPTIDATTLLEMCCESEASVAAKKGSGTRLFKKVIDQYVEEVGLPVDVPAVGATVAASYLDAHALFEIVVGQALGLEL